MPVRIENVTMDCRDGARLSSFWSAALDYEIVDYAPEDWVFMRPRAGSDVTLGLQVVPEPKVVKNRVHLDLIPTAGGLEAEILRLESLGATRLRYIQNDPDKSHWIMADPEGNEFCCSRPPWEPRPAQPEVILESSNARGS